MCLEGVVAIVKNKVYKVKAIHKYKPLIAAILNVVFLGAGYVYLGKRRLLGFGLLAVFIVMTIEYFLGNVSHIDDPINTHTISLTLLSIVLGIDAYLVGRDSNE